MEKRIRKWRRVGVLLLLSFVIWMEGGLCASAQFFSKGENAFVEEETTPEDTTEEDRSLEDGRQAEAEQTGVGQTGTGAGQVPVNIAAPSALLMEASTGQVIFEREADVERSPASVTKVMTLLLTFEALEKGAIRLTDEVVTSAHAKSMGGSQVFLEEGEIQTVDTLIKCVAVASGNDASVALAEKIAGSEEAFVEKMNQKAVALGMEHTHFEDCCGLTASDNHYTTARDIAIMSRELTMKYPQIFDYTKIWMEDITHTTAKGSSPFTLSSTNKLLKQYEWATGLKTGSTSKAKYCISATATKDDIHLIAVVLAAPDYKVRFQDAISMFQYGFAVSHLYVDANEVPLPPQKVAEGVQDCVSLSYAGAFRYLDVSGENLDEVEKQTHLQAVVEAPVKKGDKAGEVVYSLHGKVLGQVDILFAEDVAKAVYRDYLKRVWGKFLL